MLEAEAINPEEDRLYGPVNNLCAHQFPADWRERLKRLREARKTVAEREPKKGKPGAGSEEPVQLPGPFPHSLP